jgi:hypothetical protein
VKVDVEVKSITPVESIEVMHNGQSLGKVKAVTLDRQRMDLGSGEGEVHTRSDPAAVPVRCYDAEMDYRGGEAGAVES